MRLNRKQIKRKAASVPSKECRLRLSDRAKRLDRGAHALAEHARAALSVVRLAILGKNHAATPKRTKTEATMCSKRFRSLRHLQPDQLDLHRRDRRHSSKTDRAFQQSANSKPDILPSSRRGLVLNWLRRSNGYSAKIN